MFDARIREISQLKNYKRIPSEEVDSAGQENFRRRTGSVDGLKGGHRKIKNSESKLKHSFSSQISRRSSSTLNLFLTNSLVVYHEKK